MTEQTYNNQAKMARYSVEISSPSSKRMIGSGKVIVRLSNGWEGEELVSYDIQKDNAALEFDVPNEYEWKGSTSIIDGCEFSVTCEYANSTGSRKETKQLVPRKLQNQ
jgi:hypothetical protein